MKISEVKFLISILFYIDITFQESVKIIRALEGKNWTNGVDSFHIPRSVCYQESSGCRNYCNTSYTTEETETRCFCSCTCSKKYSTVTYFKNNWRCLKNEEVRTQLGEYFDFHFLYSRWMIYIIRWSCSNDGNESFAEIQSQRKLRFLFFRWIVFRCLLSLFRCLL